MLWRHLYNPNILFIFIISIFSILYYNYRENDNILFRGELDSRNIFIIRDGMYYFGSDRFEKSEMIPLHENNKRCVDAGLIAFSLSPLLKECGNFAFSYIYLDNGSILARGKCKKTQIGRCHSDVNDKFNVEYRLKIGKIPNAFKVNYPPVYIDELMKSKENLELR